MPFNYDLILKGGEVLDASQSIRATRDIGFKDGRVAAVADQLPREQGAEVLDVSGKLVVPGLIDLHGHWAHRIQPYRHHPDVACMPIGVTTAVDAGSVGWINFPGFRSYVMETSDTRLYSFLHLSSLGMGSVIFGVPDLEDFRLARSEEAIRCIEENRDRILGVKVRLSPNGTTDKNAVPALEMARQIADQTGVRIMVHVMESPLPLSQVFQYLKAGDIATHIFHGDTHSVLDEGGQVRPEVWDASRNGVIFDTAGAMRHFSIPVIRSVIQEGLLPHTISTDRIDRPDMISYNLLDHMSIYLELGLPLDEVIRCVTSGVASVIGRDDLGTFRIGSVGDAAVLELEEGDFGFEDGLGNQVRCSRRFSHDMTVKDGRRWRPHRLSS